MIKSLVTLCMVPVSILAGGWALSLEWGWFIVSTFDARPITVGQGCGIMSAAGVPLLSLGVVSSVKRAVERGRIDADNESMAVVFSMIGAYIVSTGMAWALHSVLVAGQ